MKADISGVIGKIELKLKVVIYYFKRFHGTIDN